MPAIGKFTTNIPLFVWAFDIRVYINLWISESIVETANLSQVGGNLKYNNPHAADVNWA